MAAGGGTRRRRLLDWSAVRAGSTGWPAVARGCVRAGAAAGGRTGRWCAQVAAGACRWPAEARGLAGWCAQGWPGARGSGRVRARVAGCTRKDVRMQAGLAGWGRELHAKCPGAAHGLRAARAGAGAVLHAGGVGGRAVAGQRWCWAAVAVQGCAGRVQQGLWAAAEAGELPDKAARAAAVGGACGRENFFFFRIS